MSDPENQNPGREFDLIVFGASGFTGQFVVEEVVRSVQNEPIKWAISGRSGQKLTEVLVTATKETGIDVQNIPKVEANIDDEESLRAMTGRTRLVLNCVGPYRFFGEQVVRACLETSTSHIDISGEPQYMESMQLKYNAEAQEKGIYIISACGWDSIPCDLGIQFLKKHFDGELNAVETYLKIKTGPQGLRTNYGTWQSAIHGVAAMSELRDLRRQLYTQVYTKRRPQTKFKLQRKTLPFHSDITRGWCLPFPGSDRSVVQRTQQYKYEKSNERPTQIETYFNVGNIFFLLGTLLFGAFFGVMASFGWGRSLLERYPEFFSGGMFSRKGPTREQIRDASFSIVVVGKGWAEKLTEPTDEPQEAPNKTVMVRVSGKDPGYMATSTCLVQSGLTILKDWDKLPNGGGVLTPGAAFDGTGIYDRLKEHDLVIELMNQ